MSKHTRFTFTFLQIERLVNDKKICLKIKTFHLNFLSEIDTNVTKLTLRR